MKKIASLVLLLMMVTRAVPGVERQVKASLVSIDNSGVTGFVQLTQLPHGGANVVVVANRGQQSASASFVDGKPGLRTKLLLSPANAVVLDYARRPIVGNRALLLTEAASGDLFREVREQVRCTSVAGMRTDRTAVVAIRREGRDDRISITSVHCRKVTVDDLRRTRIGR